MTINEVTLYYASVPTDTILGISNATYNEYIFTTEQEAIQSGLSYNVATWLDINMLADCGHIFEEDIINTPQGKFEWVIQYETDYDDTEIEIGCSYRHVGAPELFSEEVEDYLFWNKGSELSYIKESEGIFVAEIKNSDSELIFIKG